LAREKEIAGHKNILSLRIKAAAFFIFEKRYSENAILLRLFVYAL